MKANVTSALKHGVLVLVVVAVAYFAAMTTKPTPKGPSPECVKIQQDVAANLRVGDNEHAIIPFFQLRGWKYASASVLGFYNVKIPIRRTKVGEDHFVAIDIEVKNGIITRIDVNDLHRFL